MSKTKCHIQDTQERRVTKVIQATVKIQGKTAVISLNAFKMQEKVVVGKTFNSWSRILPIPLW